MCLLILQYRTFAEAPILVGLNRDEAFDRPATLPTIQPGPPRLLCGIDQRAGGTWLGVNEHGLLVAVTNRLASTVPEAPRSRGLLCRELLNCAHAAEAVELAVREFESGRYAGANFLCVDERTAAVVQYAQGLNVVKLPPGLHLLSNVDLDNRADERQLLARYLLASRFPNSPAAFVERVSEILSQPPAPQQRAPIVLRGQGRGTVSSVVIAVAKRRTASVFKYADGPPDQTPYQDLSSLVREVLSPVESEVGV
jgi:uncharacterized protein with NRDE domain